MHSLHPQGRSPPSARSRSCIVHLESAQSVPLRNALVEHPRTVDIDFRDRLSSSAATKLHPARTHRQLPQIGNDHQPHLREMPIESQLPTPKDHHLLQGKPPMLLALSSSPSFIQLPEILCLHIVRTTWTNDGWPTKNTCHVSFPDLLDMNPFLSLSQLLPAHSPSAPTNKRLSTALYRLNSVLVHLGGISEAGHFIIYRRRVDSDAWLSISDEYIRECSQLQVFASMAYILFYERVKVK